MILKNNMDFKELEKFRFDMSRLGHLAEAYVIQFEDGSYWKGQGGKITKELRSASFLRECDIKNIDNLTHISRMCERYYNLHTLNILKINISVVGAVGGIVDGKGGA